MSKNTYHVGVGIALNAVGVGGPTGLNAKSTDRYLRKETAKDLAAAEKDWNAKLDVLIPHVGLNGIPVGEDASKYLAEARDAWLALRDTQARAEAEVAEDRPKLIEVAEAKVAEAETKLAEAIVEIIDPLRAEIAAARADLSLVKDDSLKGRRRVVDESKYLPGGRQSVLAMIGLEQAPKIIRVRPAEMQKLQRGESAVDLEGNVVEELTGLVRVAHDVPLSARRGDASGGAWA
jgi:hypothetical protein